MSIALNARLIAGTVFALAAPLAAQIPAPQQVPEAAATTDWAISQARFQIRNMEGVLENAVQRGAQSVSLEMRKVSPDIALFSGPARARGFRLDGYGVFFAVDVPALHRSVTWSMRTLSQSNADLSRALDSIRRMVQTQHDGRMKMELEQALRLVELQVGPTTRAPALAGPLVARSARAAADSAPESAAAGGEPAGTSAVVANPSAAYTQAVQRALVDAMLDYGSTLSLNGEEWLTVAARENSDAMLAGDLSEAVTVTLRVKASDLDGFKAGRLTRDEVRQRVDMREF
jgi:hypothetical protein